MSTFRRRGRIDRSRLTRPPRNEDQWAEDLGDGIDFEVEELHEKPRPRSKGIYLLPNAFTTAALFSGFFAIVNAMNDQFQVAAIAIFASLVLDGMDGRIARAAIRAGAPAFYAPDRAGLRRPGLGGLCALLERLE